MSEPRRGVPPTQPEREYAVMRQHTQGSMGGETRSSRPSTSGRVMVSYGTPGSMEVVQHGDDGTVGRPNVQWVLWVGAATPANALPYDGWYTADVP